jgi:hypothetical protein
MGRKLPKFDEYFESEVSAALALTSSIEKARLMRDSGRNLLASTQAEFVYELAYLRIFLSWETLLESTLLRLMCGYHISSGPEPLVSGRTYFTRLANAEAALLGRQRYQLWHNPNQVIRRARVYFANSRYEVVLLSATTRLEHFAAVRHRIAHGQRDAQLQFDQATMSLAGKRYGRSRPGKFLREQNPSSSPPERWINILSRELVSLANQICL